MKTAQPGTNATRNNGSAAQMPVTHTIKPRRRHQGPPNGLERREVMYSGRHDYLPHDEHGHLLPGAHQGPELKKPRKAPTNEKLRFEIAPTVKSHKTINGQVVFPTVITAEQSGKLGDMTEQEIKTQFGSNYLRIETQSERNERLHPKAPTREPHQEQNQEPQVMPRPMTIQDFAERFLTAYENQAGLMREILRRLDDRPAPTQAQEPEQVEHRTAQEPRRTDPGKRAIDRTRAHLAHQESHQEPTQAAHQEPTRERNQEPPRAAKPTQAAPGKQAAPDNSRVYFIDVNKVTPKQMFGIIKSAAPETVHIFGTGDINATGAKRKLEILQEHDVKAISPAQAAQIQNMRYTDIDNQFGAHDFVVVPLLAQEPPRAQPGNQAQARSVKSAINQADPKQALIDACAKLDEQLRAARINNTPEPLIKFGDHTAKFKRLAMECLRAGMPTREANNYAARLAYGDKADRVII